MSTSLLFSCKDSKEKINCPGDFVIVYMVYFPKALLLQKCMIPNTSRNFLRIPFAKIDSLNLTQNK